MNLQQTRGNYSIESYAIYPYIQLSASVLHVFLTLDVNMRNFQVNAKGSESSSSKFFIFTFDDVGMNQLDGWFSRGGIVRSTFGFTLS